MSKEGRIRTTQEITAFTDRYEGPKVLVGDFNEVSHEEPIRHIVEQASFSDSWERLHPDEPGLTYSDANTYVDNEPDNGGRRIDYVFARDGAKVERCEIVGNVPDSEGHFPADHFGLIAEVCVENSR